ncbi:MAG: hypothetical protein AAB646_02810, partial [Patescibacteria group bacterium]
SINKNNMNKKLLIVVLLVVVLIVLGLKILKAPSEEQTAQQDEAALISQELESIDLGNLDQEFQSVDKDLNTL